MCFYFTIFMSLVGPSLLQRLFVVRVLHMLGTCSLHNMQNGHFRDTHSTCSACVAALVSVSQAWHTNPTHR